MLDTDFLKTLTVLYVEDDIDAREDLELIFSKGFKKIILASNGLEALTIYNDSLKVNSSVHIDIIVSDINMPEMDGIGLLKHIRMLNKNIPFVITTGYANNENLLKAIENDVSYLCLKPVDMKKLIIHILKLARVTYNHKLALHNHNEAKEYLSIIDKVAIVSKTDRKGIITFVNDIFCDTSGYTREELLGKNHNIVRHPDMPKSAFEDLWKTIKNEKEWYGKIKNKSKDGDSYHVNSTVFPLYNDIDTSVIGYMAIRFLTTDEENQKREFKTQVRDLVSKYNSTIKDLKSDNLNLNERLKHFDDEHLRNRIIQEKKKSDKLVVQVQNYETDLKRLKQQTQEQKLLLNEKTHSYTELSNKLDYQKLSANNEIKRINEDLNFVKDEMKSKIKYMDKQSKIILDLKDVIKHS